MHTRILGLAVAAAWVLGAAAAGGQDLVREVAQGCEAELSTHCSDVTAGEGRKLACLYAYGDKLSTRCEYALYDAAVQLERAVAALTFVANECEADLEKFCADVEVGGGRVLDCLRKSQISDRCTAALSDVGAK